MLLVRACSRNLAECSILARKSNKGHQKFYPTPTPLYSIPFLSVLYRNKALHNFCKRRQHLIVDRDIGLEYALLAASNSHISATLSHPLWKNVNYSKSYILAVPLTMFFKVLKYFFSSKMSFFFYLLGCGNKISNWKNFSEILTDTTVGFFQKKNDGLWLEFAVFGSEIYNRS